MSRHQFLLTLYIRKLTNNLVDSGGGAQNRPWVSGTLRSRVMKRGKFGFKQGFNIYIYIPISPISPNFVFNSVTKKNYS